MTTTDTVVAVLLADGWHHIVPGSFQVAPLSFGPGADPGVPGYRFEEADTASPYGPATLAGPLTALLAVRQAATSRRHRQPGLAAAEGQLEIVRYLLAAGAVPQPADRWGGTPLTDAETGGHTQVAKLLTQAADKKETAV